MFESVKNIKKTAMFLVIAFSILLIGGLTEKVMAGNGSEIVNPDPDKTDHFKISPKKVDKKFIFTLYGDYQLMGSLGMEENDGTDGKKKVRCLSDPFDNLTENYSLTTEDGQAFTLEINDKSDPLSVITILTEAKKKSLSFNGTEKFDFSKSDLEKLPDRSNGYTFKFTNEKGNSESVSISRIIANANNDTAYEDIIENLQFTAHWDKVEKTLNFDVTKNLPDGYQDRADDESGRLYRMPEP